MHQARKRRMFITLPLVGFCFAACYWFVSYFLHGMIPHSLPFVFCGRTILPSETRLLDLLAIPLLLALLIALRYSLFEQTVRFRSFQFELLRPYAIVVIGVGGFALGCAYGFTLSLFFGLIITVITFGAEFLAQILNW